jgi:type III secretory pathway lipoprotein EscJ
VRTIDRLSYRSALPWLRQGVDRLRRALQARRPAVRWGLVLTAVLVLAGAGYWMTLAWVPVATRYLDSGRPLAKDDLIKAERALKAHGIDCRIEDRKLVVAAEQYDQAAAQLNKLDVGPRSFDEIRQPPQPWSSWVDPLEVRERKERLNQERMLEGFLNELEGVVSSVVSIHTPSAKAARGRSRPSVFVSVETEADHGLPARTIDAITTILTSNLPELSPEAITVMDRHGGPPYYDQRNPAASDRSRKGAREEEIRAAILSKIAWIKGVQVWVELLDRPGAEPAAAPPPPPAPAPAQAEGPAPPPAERSPNLVVNQPLVLEEPERSPPVVPPAPAPTPAPATPVAPARVERGRILVNVPRSSYYHMIWTGSDHREPSVEELHAAAARTKSRSTPSPTTCPWAVRRSCRRHRTRGAR